MFALNTSEEAVWIDSWTVLPHELKECNLKWHALQSSHLFWSPARGRHARGEGAPARDAYHDVSPSFQLPGGRCVICQKCWGKAIGLAQAKRAKALYIYILGLNISFIKICIERWSSTPTINKRQKIIFNQRHDKHEKKKKDRVKNGYFF